MPHDMKGQKLKVGDKVNVPCVVKEIQAGTEYYNVTLETVHPMFPGKDTSTITLNTKQVKKTTAKS